ncbi:struthiocalcin-2-like isoform X3 [Hippocampus zosterae]|uniref:struthiocalcin-2-like isoform X3 n=1 Tax=Hippocampus zosterae TaxID=109293 RepID=UPI00223DBB4E|nr:struthiocalcin-2-like isoform X3 [Hippocampus zosterae]
MAFVLRWFVLLCGIIGLESLPNTYCVADNSCPKGWTQLNDRCFIFQDYPRAFADAESVCNILGGNLVSIDSALEYAVVLQVVQDGTSDPSADVWIGLHRGLGDNLFFWTDGSDVGFTAFNANTNPGNCVEIEDDDLRWDTDLCSLANRFVCARDVKKCGH